MKNILYAFFTAIILSSCVDAPPRKVAAEKLDKKPDTLLEKSVAERAAQLKKEGYQTFTYEEGDTTYLMQQYYLVFLKSGPNRSQDSTRAAELQTQHLAFLERMGKEGYASLIGPLDSEGEICGIAVYNTKTKKEADSLANQDPMVKAGRLKIEVHPWWTAKGGKLN